MLSEIVFDVGNGYRTVIDVADAGVINVAAWRVRIADEWSRKNYVFGTTRKALVGFKKSTSLHRYILSAPDGVLVDHRNGDTLDNRRNNLRLCDATENSRNQISKKQKSGACKGVLPIGGKWVARICAGRPLRDGRKGQIHLGTFDTEVEAAHAYDLAALRYFGEFAALNFPGASEERELVRQAILAKAIPRTHCSNGHDLADFANEWGRCRRCNLEAQKRYQARKKSK